ncbi:MAG TPA: hypothetical protein VN598_01875 [Usitatibacter sp.]|nr:hypothetical protein [Usitatibacter sp.]
MWKHVGILLATVAAFAFSIRMMSQVIGFTSPWMVLLLFFCFLGLAKIAEPVYMLKLPASVRGLRPWELRGDVYRMLGVPGFGALLRNTPLRFANTTVYVSRQRRDPALICRQVESAEAIHFWGTLVLVPYLAFCLWTGRWNVLGAFLAVQVIGNAYPIMHLRSVRGRLDRLSRRAVRA